MQYACNKNEQKTDNLKRTRGECESLRGEKGKEIVIIISKIKEKNISRYFTSWTLISRVSWRGWRKDSVANSSSKSSTALFWSLWVPPNTPPHPHTHCVHMLTHTTTQKHNDMQMYLDIHTNKIKVS